jgi:AcrR family transcriptional regulator
MTSNHLPGRPRSHDVDASILDEAVALLAAKGPDGVTINAVARRSGVARASIYLRYPTRQALLAAALRAAIGREPYPLTGELLTDLHLGGLQAQAILANQRFRTVLPEIVRELLRTGDGADTITYDMVAPNRGPIAEEYRRLAGAAGLRTDVDPDMPMTVIVGTLLMWLLANGSPPTVAVAEQVVELTVAGLAVPATSPATRDDVPGRRTMAKHLSKLPSKHPGGTS